MYIFMFKWRRRASAGIVEGPRGRTGVASLHEALVVCGYADADLQEFIADVVRLVPRAKGQSENSAAI